ncbi:DUF3895 domain-containing protein [Paenibacillus apiarius]|uniref:DUF3895 domain-containing protein n=1 Tax=Paenibacillus apiarius TaxID=46240 RepID=UPI003B3A2F69
MILTVEERDSILSELNEQQRDFLSKQLVRSRRTVFANAMAKDKGYHVPENADPEDIEALLDEWVYTGYIDAGAVSPELRCECGRSLRYQHQVEHKKTGEIKKFGIEHLKEHLGIDASMVSAIKKGFDAIDYELDEMLIKMKSGWQPNPEILGIEGLPEDVMSHLKLGLPLLDRQVKRLRQQPPVRKALVDHYSPPVQHSSSADDIVLDLFTWQEEPAAPKPAAASSGLPASLHAPIRAYIADGVRSARVMCELLIREQHADEERFMTGKPKIYAEVCRFIEQSYPNASVQALDQEDRSYFIPE